MNSWRFRVGFAAAAALVILATVACGPPSDKSLLSAFTKNRKQLEALVSDVTSDATLAEYVQADGLSNGVEAMGLSQERYREYKSRLQRLGVVEIYDNREADAEIRLVCHVPAIGHTSVLKGYAYLTGTVPRRGRLVKDLDGWPRQAEAGYRHIEGNWYLFTDAY